MRSTLRAVPAKCTCPLFVALLPILLAGCAGYQIGNRSLYPTHIRTVYVPMFESNSFRRNLGQRLTEAVQKEIELKTPYKVVDTPEADSILTGRIVNDTKRVLIQGISGNATDIQVKMAVNVSWTDTHQDTAIRGTQSIPLPPEVTAVDGTGSIIPQIGQSVATAQDQAIHRLAEQIVALMEAPW